jgi:hypothetical protein
MHWKTAWKDWKGVTAALVVCLGAFLLNGRAWRVGYEGSATGLLGCHFLRLLLLLLAWAAVLATFNAAARREQPAAGRGVPLGAVICAFFLIPACVGCYPVWPVILGLLVPPVLVGLFLARKKTIPPGEDAGTRKALLQVGLATLLFTGTWYACADVTRQAMLGLGARIEAHGGSEKLLDWAADVIAARRRWQQALQVEGATAVGLAAAPPGPGGLLTASAWVTARAYADRPLIWYGEMPDWVEQLLGRFEGVRSAMVYPEPGGYGGADPCVILFTGSSAYHFQIFLRPSRKPRDPPLWCFGEGTAGLEWRPGIVIETGGK